MLTRTLGIQSWLFRMYINPGVMSLQATEALPIALMAVGTPVVLDLTVQCVLALC